MHHSKITYSLSTIAFSGHYAYFFSKARVKNLRAYSPVGAVTRHGEEQLNVNRGEVNIVFRIVHGGRVPCVGIVIKYVSGYRLTMEERSSIIGVICAPASDASI